jgi:hypothetical protein
MWLLGRLAPDFKTIANFRKNNGEAIRLVCREFVMLCRKLNLFSEAFVAKRPGCSRLTPALRATWARLPVPTGGKAKGKNEDRATGEQDRGAQGGDPNIKKARGPDAGGPGPTDITD